MNTPEYHRIYSPEDFNPMWLEGTHTDDITAVYLPTTTTVKEPGFTIPFAARVYQTPYFVLNGKIQHRNDTLGMKEELPKNLRHRKSVVLAELWQARDDNGEHALQGFVFISEMEFLGDPKFSVNYEKILNSEDFKH